MQPRVFTIPANWMHGIWDYLRDYHQPEPSHLLPSQSTHAQVYFLLNSKVLPPTYVHKGRAGLLSLSLSLNSKVGQEGRRRSQKAVCSLLGLKVSFLNHMKPIRSIHRQHVFFDGFRRVPISRDCLRIFRTKMRGFGAGQLDVG